MDVGTVLGNEFSGDRFINNELVKVLSLDEQKMVVLRGNGKEAVISCRDLVHVDQGITVTSYSSQSKGPDQMLCSAPVRAFGAVDRKQFYLTMSRARRSMHLYTDSIDGLREAICRTGERLSVVELANDSEAYLQRMQEFARNIFQAKRQHDIEPPRRPTPEQEQGRGISI
jgi:ATP-dependent exoDNAse (exonuclease V) alpha subunit